MNRRGFVAGMGAILTVPFTVEAQREGRVRKIGALVPTFPEGKWVSEDLRSSLRRALRELAYIEDRNIVIEWRSDPASATELVARKVDVIVAGTNTHIAAAQKATKTIPIVMVHPTDPVALGFVADLSRPGGNTTGLSLQSRDLSGKRLQLFKQALPNLLRVAILWDPAELSGFRETVVKEAVAAAHALGLDTRQLETEGAHGIDATFAAMTRDPGTAVFIAGGIRTQTWAELATKNRLPTTCGAPRAAELGCLMFYGADFAAHYRRAATYVDKILKGAKPGDLPIEQPTQFQLVINLKTAKALGLTIPQSVLLRADQVIE